MQLFAEALSGKPHPPRSGGDGGLRQLGNSGVKDKLLSGSAFDQLAAAATDAQAATHSCWRGRTRVFVRRVFLGKRSGAGSQAESFADSNVQLYTQGGRLASWIRGEHAIKILVGYDFSAASDAALDWVNELGKIGKLVTNVLYTNWPPDEARRLGYEGPLPLAANPKQIQKNLEGDLKKRIARFLRNKK